MNTDENAPQSRQIEAQSRQQTPTDKNRPMITTEEFERWWNQEGSAINPTVFEDTSEHVKRVSEIAWANGHYMATVTNLKSQQWQPIETAPKDGTDVIVVDIDGDRFIASSIDGQNWYDGLYPIDYPTHWMPLPAPPTENDQ